MSLIDNIPQISIQFLDNSNHCYRAGDQIRCRVLADFTYPTKLQCISIQYKGRAKTTWPEVLTKNESRTFTGREQYFCSYHVILGVQNGPEQLITPGLYKFNSVYRLPSRLPSSIKCCFGDIYYTVSVQIQSSQVKHEPQVRSFTIAPFMDLNEEIDFKKTSKDISTKQLGCNCCCFKPGFVDMVTVIPCTGYIPGENVSIFIEVTNKSRIDITHIKCQLVEEIIFHAMTPFMAEQYETRYLWDHEFQRVPSGQNRFYQTNLFLNPDAKFKLLGGCGIIDVKYFIRTIANTSKNDELINQIQIVIGTVAFSDGAAIHKQNIKKEVISRMKHVMRKSLLITTTNQDPSDLDSPTPTETDPLIPKAST